MKKDSFRQDNYFFIPASIDVGNYQTKAEVCGVEWICDSVLAIAPKGHFEPDEQPEYYSNSSLEFAVGKLAKKQDNFLQVGDDSKTNKTFSIPYLVVAAISDCVPSLLTKKNHSVVRPLVMFSLQSVDLEAATRQSLSELPDEITISRFGSEFVLDVNFMRENAQFRQEGHAIARIAAKTNKSEKPVLLIDFGGRTIHATDNDAQGFSTNNTCTVENAGTLALFEEVMADENLSKCFSQDLNVDSSTLADWVVLGENAKLTRLTSKHVFDWLQHERNSVIWKRLELALESGQLVALAGGGSGLPGFQKAFAKLLSGLKIAPKLRKNVVLASDLFGVPANKANCKSLYAVARAKLKKLMD